MHAERARIVVWLERALLVVGVTCLAYYGYHIVEARQFQQAQAAVVEERLATEPVPALAPVSRERGAFALLEIPRLKISTPVLAGDDEETLDLGVGHLPDTPRPWESGNSAFAAHRDGVFRPLKDIRIGDEVHVRSPEGVFTYRVKETKVVKPDDLSVLDRSETDTLTLITCYPFSYVGHAPRRFIVRAEKLRGGDAHAAVRN